MSCAGGGGRWGWKVPISQFVIDTNAELGNLRWLVCYAVVHNSSSTQDESSQCSGPLG